MIRLPSFRFDRALSSTISRRALRPRGRILGMDQQVDLPRLRVPGSPCDFQDQQAEGKFSQIGRYLNILQVGKDFSSVPAKFA